MKILSIGNSFSQDAQRYLHGIAKQESVDIYSANLIIGGCSLETHCINISEDNSDYEIQINGNDSGELISIKKALLSDCWDYITLQQVSHLSGDYSTYNPYIKELFNYVKSLCPTAKILIHQTWAYEDKSERLLTLTPFKSADEMFFAIQTAYNRCLKELPFDGLIPSGMAMMQAIKLGIEKAHRDTFHASLGAGRYLLGLTWYKYFTGKEISQNSFDNLDEAITNEQRSIIIKAVNSVFK